MYKKTNPNSATVEIADYGRLDEMGKRLKAAVPQLIVMVCSKGNLEYEVADPSIRKVDLGWDQLLDEGYDPYGSPLGPVYWRIVRRDDQKLYLSTFPVRRDDVIRILGTARSCLLRSKIGNRGGAARNCSSGSKCRGITVAASLQSAPKIGNHLLRFRVA